MTTEVLEKAKRGRPASVMPEDLYLGYKMIFGDDQASKRSMLNKHYMLAGFGILKAMSERGITGIDFLYDPLNTHIPREGVLRELGHISNVELAEKIAVTICECEKAKHQTTRWYETTIRRCRLNGLLQYLPVVIKETVSENSEVEK
jgi:hypothetical protein